MKRSLMIGILALAPWLTSPHTSAVVAQACASFPSTDCPAPGVPRGALSYPCYPGQIKGDWYSMNYYVPAHPDYSSIGSALRSDTWCFDTISQAQDLRFSKS